MIIDDFKSVFAKLGRRSGSAGAVGLNPCLQYGGGRSGQTDRR